MIAFGGPTERMPLRVRTVYCSVACDVARAFKTAPANIKSAASGETRLPARPVARSCRDCFNFLGCASNLFSQYPRAGDQSNNPRAKTTCAGPFYRAEQFEERETFSLYYPQHLADPETEQGSHWPIAVDVADATASVPSRQ